MGYEIRYWRELTNSPGQPFRVVLARFAIDEDDMAEAMLARATAAFCRLMQVTEWRIVAHGYEFADEAAMPAADGPRALKPPAAVGGATDRTLPATLGRGKGGAKSGGA